ncbi:MAG: PQQ-binding-like beta-propeller repeat protein [Pseudomonadota bacterium]
MIARIFHWIFIVFLILVGLLLTLPGGGLIYLGGSPYYLLAGIAVLACALFTIRRSPKAVYIYGALLGVTVLWAIFESGLDFMALLPRLAFWMGIGLWFLMPWFLGSETKDTHTQHASRKLWIGGPIVASVLVLFLGAIQGYDQNSTGTVRSADTSLGTDWAHYGNSAGGSRFAAIDQINTDTVGNLKEVWRYRTGVEEDFKATPLSIDERLYLCAAANVLISLDAETGEEVWRYDPEITPPDRHQYAITCRGVSYHAAPADYEGDCPTRIVSATVDASLIAVNADTGELCSDFGEQGRVDLRVGLGEHLRKEYYVTSPPTVAGDNLVVGGLVLDSQDLGLPSGVVRAFNALTGELAWAWDLGNPGNRGLPAEGETYTLGTPNVWSIMSYDPELDLVYAPTGNANPDYFGGLRRDFTCLAVQRHHSGRPFIVKVPA